MSKNKLSRKVRSLSVSEVMENIMPDPNLPPTERIEKTILRVQRKNEGWRGRLYPDGTSGGYHKVVFRRELARVEMIVGITRSLEVVGIEAEVFFLDYPLRVEPLERPVHLVELFERRREELIDWLRAQATHHES